MTLPKNIEVILESFRPRHILVVLVLCVIFIASLAVTLKNLHDNTLVEIPAYGGSITEGIVGIPRLINPVLAESNIDKDMVSLIYSGLVKRDIDGTIVPDLAESYTISENGLEYTFVLKDNAVFHDGTPVTADDVVYTILLIQDKTVKSPYSILWEGVRVEKIDDITVKFTLRKEYDDFLDKARVGILPKHIWQDLGVQTLPLSDYNQLPVGSGPFKIQDLTKNGGVPTKYELAAFSDYASGRPYIDTLTVKTFTNEKLLVDALEAGTVDAVARLNPEYAGRYSGSVKKTTLKRTLPRTYTLFINQSRNQNLVDKDVRTALLHAIDKKRVVTEALYGFGTTACSPIPQTLFQKECPDVYDIEQARSLLQKAGYTDGPNGLLVKSGVPLTLEITTLSGVPELQKTAEVIVDNLKKVGIQASVVTVSKGDIQQKVIRDRSYQVLLYGNEVTTGSELYAYLHSSQRNHPGLNLSNYAGTETDNVLEQLRKESDLDAQQALYKKIDDAVNADIPSIYLFSPVTTYVYANPLHIVAVDSITNPSERYDRVTDWYINTEYVWPFIQSSSWLKTIRNYIY